MAILRGYRIAQTAYRLAGQSYSDALDELSNAIRSAGQSPAPRRQPAAWFAPSGVAGWLTPDAREELSTTVTDLSAPFQDTRSAAVLGLGH